MNLGINIGLGSAALMGRAPDPNDIRISGSRVCKLWSEPAIGTTDPSVASVPADLSTWGTKEKITVGGTGEYTLTETTDGSAVGHYLNSTITNGISSYVDLYFETKYEGRAWVVSDPSSQSEEFRALNIQTGDVGNGHASITAELLGTTVDGWLRWVVRKRNISALRAYTYISNANPTVLADANYQGDGRLACRIRNFSYAQIRASAQNNLARADNGTLIDATGGVQTTIANQPLILDQNGEFYTGASGQIPVVTREAGRVSYLAYTDPDVLAVANGDDPAFWIFGIWKGTGSWAFPLGWSAAPTGLGADYSIPLVLSGTQVWSHLRHGENISTIKIANSIGAIFADWATFAVVRNSDRSQDTWINGVVRPTITHSVVGSVAAGCLITGDPINTAPEQQHLALVAGSGQLPGANAAARYAAIRPALLAACARYPGLGLVA